MTAPVVQVRGVAKQWDATSGLAAVSFTVDPGEVVAVRGRSGSGKSTLLAILAGWCNADAGDVVRDSDGSGDASRTWAATAIVPQVLGLVEELSAVENVAVVLRLAGHGARDASDAAAGVLSRLDLAELASRLPREMSLGQQQRLAVARAVVAGPALLLADEPTCHQDGAHASSVMAELRAVAGAGGGVLVASHDDSVVAAADRVVSLDD